MRKLGFYVFLPLLLAFNQGDSIKLEWDFLKKHVVFKEKYKKSVDMLLLYPTFTEEIKRLNGKKAEIKGYMIESDVSAGIYILSRYPMAECYFCGAAGPESIVEIQLINKQKRYRTDQVAVVSGTFHVNANDIEHCNYILKSAVVTE
ncbi:MAG: hypothetical protein ACJAWV_002536 [Flammeovirgaceae bacterium]|jgi:hypothetical protein